MILFVSKRLQAAAAALILLAFGQLAAAVAEPETPPAAVRVAISR